jgi:type I restriction enzyme, S subunit
MGSEWVNVRLGDCVDTCLGKMLDKQKNQGSLAPYLGNKDVRWGRFDLDDLSQMKFLEHEHEKYGLRRGDLVVCEGGEPGRCAIWSDEVPNMKIQKALHRIRTHDCLHNVFLYHWFCFAAKQGLLDPYFTGTTIQHLSGKAIVELQIPLPPLAEQRTIAHILASLDDKIELNRRMNSTLEAMAQALFKSWFVDFDPVIDNALSAGNPIPEELAERAEVRRVALVKGSANREAAKPFPAVFEQTEELGWIPEGWEVSSVGRHVSLQRGTTYKSRLKGLPGPYLLGLGSIQRNGGFKENTLKTYGGDCPPKMVLKPGDIFVSLKDITQAADLLGSVARLPHHISSGRLTQDTVKLVFDSEPVSKDYIYNMLLTERYRDYCRSRATGTTNLGLAREDFFGFPFAIPSSEVQIAYDRFVQSCNEKHQVNTAECISLTKLRDTLLPKLISGELRIPDTEKLAEAALA